MAMYSDRDRFIPYRRAEIIKMLCEEKVLTEEDKEKFAGFCKIISSLYHFEFHEKIEFLKDNYYPFNPDKDTHTSRIYSAEEMNRCEKNLVEKFTEVLNDANYEKITDEDLALADKEESLFNISLEYDKDDFDSHLLFWRGSEVKKEQVKKFVFSQATLKNLFSPVEMEVPTFERVAMLIKFKDEEYFKNKGAKNLPFEPGSMMIKLFKYIPKADLEMLFPNTKIKMKPKDKLILGLPAIIGAVGTITKTAAGLVAFGTVLATMITTFFKGGEPSISPKDIPAMVGGLTALGLIGGFVFKQWVKYKNRKILFMKVLGDSLYFKNLDNNAGVFNHIIDAAEEEECKEAMLAYFFLLQHKDGLTEQKLDDIVEDWFEKKHKILIDFEVDDAIRKLVDLELCTTEQKNGETIYKALPIDKANERLDYIWDNYFQYN